METSLFACIGHPDACSNATKTPWWHYFERVPIKGGPVPIHWVDATASRVGKKVHARCNDRGKVPFVICNRCKGRVRNSVNTNYDHCHQCRKTSNKLHTSGDPICTSCWYRSPVPGKKTCQECLDTRNARNAERRRLEREW